jgi:hypothetical protein
MGSHRPFDIWNTSYGQKKGQESNWQFNSWPLKVWNWPDFHACKWRATYRWKALNEGYNFALDLISIKGLHAKLWRPQNCESPNLGNFGTPTWESQDKKPFGCGSHRVYYKGEGGGFPQVQAVVSFVSLSCPWLVLAPKVLQLCTNHFVLVLCRPVWISKACQFFLVPSRSSNTPLYLPKCCERGNVPQLLALLLFSIWDSHLSPSRSWEHVTFCVGFWFRFGGNLVLPWHVPNYSMCTFGSSLCFYIHLCCKIYVYFFNVW